MKALACVLLVLLLAPSAAHAQNHQDLVALVKAELVAHGVDLSGPCGAFQVTKRVAWRLRGEGYGLLGGKTPGQNGCAEHGDKFAVDWLLKADGNGVDILVDAGGQNTPIWGPDTANAAFYRPAFDPGDGPPTPPDPPSPPDLQPIYAALEDLVNRLDLLEQRLRDADARLSSRIDTEVTERTAQDTGHDQQLQILTSRPVFTGCRVPILGCRLTP